MNIKKNCLNKHVHDFSFYFAVAEYFPLYLYSVDTKQTMKKNMPHYTLKLSSYDFDAKDDFNDNSFNLL